jgi:hypothetical protein
VFVYWGMFGMFGCGGDEAVGEGAGVLMKYTIQCKPNAIVLASCLLVWDKMGQ